MSPIFDSRVRDISCWTMGPEMFRQFPELHSDIVAIDQIPPAIQSRRQIGFQNEAIDRERMDSVSRICVT
jgi:hypothetical protein